MAKVLLINGSGNEHGCTFTALSEAARALNEEGVETEIIQLGVQTGSCRTFRKTRRNYGIL